MFIFKRNKNKSRRLNTFLKNSKYTLFETVVGCASEIKFVCEKGHTLYLSKEQKRKGMGHNQSTDFDDNMLLILSTFFNGSAPLELASTSAFLDLPHNGMAIKQTIFRS